MPRARRLAILAAVLLAGLAPAAPAVAEYTGPRVPLGILVTNWNCQPCAPANQALDAWYPSVGDQFALIRVHCWWPGANDPIYLANVPQSRYLIWDTPNGPDTAPHLWVDNVVNGGTYADAMVGYLEDRARVPAPLVIDLAWNEDTQEVGAEISVLNEMPVAEYRFFVAITEDSVAAEGANGEPYHNQAFRHLYPDTLGVPVDGTPGEQTITVPAPLSASWVYPQLRATAYVQNRDTGEVQNAATIVLAEAATAAPDAPAAGDLALRAYPNPFNPLTRIRYAVPAGGPVTVRVHDLAGRTVRTLVDGPRPAGEHETAWRGRDDRGRRLASGVYLVLVRAAGRSASHKLVLAE